ncbi:MAG: DUF1616 domain-containing protein [Candidatus Bathyarchaeota archaeon]|nr:DUF1616 domain-containing protein [Candidatus Bathyarchaeota archaeon]
MRLQSDKLGRIVRIDDDKGFLVAVLVALIVVCSVVAGYFVVAALYLEPESYSTIYILDSQKNALDYPATLVANQNSTFQVYVDVVNHMNDPINYEVQVKVTRNLGTLPVAAEPIQTFTIDNLQNGATAENSAVLTLNSPGEYSVIFELWHQDESGTYIFEGYNYCILNIQVTN